MKFKKRVRAVMSFLTVDLDWEREIPEIKVQSGYEGILGLVRCQGLPVGMVRAAAKDGQVNSESIRQLILAQVGNPTLCPSYGPAGEQPCSIVVCTHERPDLLGTCLTALLPFHQKGHEVIIVDNAPVTEKTGRLVDDYPYKHVIEPNKGLNNARNFGLQLASNEIIAFTDDDCLPDPGWLEALSGPYVDDTVWGTTGLVIPYEMETSSQVQFEDYCANRRIFQRRFYSSPPLTPSEAGVVGMGANMSFRRKALEKLGGFDSRFDGGTPTMSGGDTDIFARLLKAGGRIVYRPDALVRHRHVREDRVLKTVIFGYGVGLYAFLMKRLLEEQDWSVLKTAPRWLLGPPMKAVLNRLTGRPATPWDLVFYEFMGSLRGPLRYLEVKMDKRYKRYREVGV
jgi:GT2 family glycosyltransferase